VVLADGARAGEVGSPVLVDQWRGSALNVAVSFTMTMTTTGNGSRATVNIGRATEIAFACIASFIFGTQSLQMLLGSTDQAAGGRPVVVYLVFLSIYAVTLTILFSDLRFVRHLILCWPLILLILLFPFISTLWSVQPGDTWQRSIAGFGSSCFGLYLFWRFGLTIAIRILAVAMTCAALGSLFVSLFFPHIGLMVDETWAGAWRGLFYHKNSLGAAIALATIFLIYVALTDTPIFRVLALCGLIVCGLLLVGSRSMTAVFATAFSLGLIVWARAVQRSPNILVILTLVSVLGGGVFLFILLSFTSIEDGFALLGKKAGMSGRFPLWEQVANYIAQKPWLGYGYEAFWNDASTETQVIASVIRYTPFYSHNGGLETLLNGGVVLFIIIGILFVLFMRRAWNHARLQRSSFISGMPLVFFGFMILSNISESHILMRNDLIWSITVGLSMRLSLEKTLQQYEKSHHA
jgi:O-antigen ligase